QNQIGQQGLSNLYQALKKFNNLYKFEILCWDSNILSQEKRRLRFMILRMKRLVYKSIFI
ncbi:hypothetical protein ABPG73_011937, partial [Tetrahymena malaccensis]